MNRPRSFRQVVRGVFSATYTPAFRIWGATVHSGDGEEHKGARFSLMLGVLTLGVALPQFVCRPYRVRVTPSSWSEADIAKLGRNWYWDYTRREFGITLSSGDFLCVFHGKQTDDSSTEERWSWFLPWRQYRMTRVALFDEIGEVWWEEEHPKGFGREAWDRLREAEAKVPTVPFTFADYDGEVIDATTYVEETEHRIGTGRFQWVSFFLKPRISRSLLIRFSKEVGPEKGSWKGGTLGHGIDLHDHELHASGWNRYYIKHVLNARGR